MASSKIVSLVPSLTELLFELGLGEQVIGRTRFCIHPKKMVKSVPIIGGTKNPNVDDILKMNPGLIIANKEENRKEDIEKLKEGSEVWVSDIQTIEDALFAIYSIAEKLGAAEMAEPLIQKIQRELNLVPEEPSLTTAYFIWRDPWMSIGNDTYIHSVLSHWNLTNVFGNQIRYPKTTLKELAEKSPDLIILSSEPYPFKEKHIQEVGKYCPNSNIVCANGEWFSWYGSRMISSFRNLNMFRKAIG